MAGRCARVILAILARHRSIDKQAAKQLLPLIPEACVLIDHRNEKNSSTTDSDRASIAHALSQLVSRLAAQQELDLPAARRGELIGSLAATCSLLINARLKKKESLPVRAGCAVMPACMQLTCLH